MTALPQRRVPRDIFWLIAGFFAVWSVRATVLYRIDEAIASDTLRLLYSTCVKLILWGLPAWGFALWRQRTAPQPLHYLGLSVWPSTRQWTGALIGMGLFLGAIIVTETRIGQKTLLLTGIGLSFMWPSLLSTFVSPWIEEVLFRGVILKELAGVLPGWAANLLTSLLFVGIHLPFWLTHNPFPLVMVNSVGVFIFSLFAGILYLKTT